MICKLQVTSGPTWLGLGMAPRTHSCGRTPNTRPPKWLVCAWLRFTVDDCAGCAVHSTRRKHSYQLIHNLLNSTQQDPNPGGVSKIPMGSLVKGVKKQSTTCSARSFLLPIPQYVLSLALTISPINKILKEKQSTIFVYKEKNIYKRKKQTEATIKESLSHLYQNHFINYFHN